MRIARLFAALWLAVAVAPAENRPDRLEWFRDAGFGLFIHWSVDSQLGSVISHSLVGATEDYIQRFFRLPETFNPKKFDAREWAMLARLAGFRYVVFTAKHHSGFCMYDTRTTGFNIMRTPFGHDITAEVLKAFGEQGIAPGLYFPALMKYDLEQIRELLMKYGDIHTLFLDGPAEGLRDLAWQLQPNIVVTRGAMETPEQYIPGVPIEGPWESCITMGNHWQYKPFDEEYKSGTELIRILIETRAKGGNLLLNIGPRPDGEIPVEQEARLREIALWMFVNSESIYGVRPWVVTNENDIWFTRAKTGDAVYAFVTGPRWKLGEWNEITLRSLRAGTGTQVSVLGQNDKVLEYRSEVVPKTMWRQDDQSLHIRAMHAQRLTDDRKWPNPIVLKITGAQPGMTPPAVITGTADPAPGGAVLHGELKSLGNVPDVQVGFEYRPRKGLTDLYEKTEPWKATPLVSRSTPGRYSLTLTDLQSGQAYDYRAAVKHPLITIYGAEKAFTAR